MYTNIYYYTLLCETKEQYCYKFINIKMDNSLK